MITIGWSSRLQSPEYAIELAFSKLKRLLRDAAERSVEELWQTIGRLLNRFRPDECANYIRHCGFAQSAR